MLFIRLHKTKNKSKFKIINYVKFEMFTRANDK